MMFGLVVMLMLPGMLTRHGRMLALAGSEVVHVTVAPVRPFSGVPLISVTVAVQIEPVEPAAIVLGAHSTEIRGTPLGETTMKVEPTAVRPPIDDWYVTLTGASPAAPAPIARTAAPVHEYTIGKVEPVGAKNGLAPEPNGLTLPPRPQPTSSMLRPLSKISGPGVAKVNVPGKPAPQTDRPFAGIG